MHRWAPRPRLETGMAGDDPADTATAVIVIVSPHREAPNLPGGVSDETSPYGSPRSHRP